MAIVTFRGETHTNADATAAMLAGFGIPYEHWGVRHSAAALDADLLNLYARDIERLKQERGYQSVDLVALSPDTPNLSAVLTRFRAEHHHTDDEVRYTVAGEGVFAIRVSDAECLYFTAQPGDLIVIPQGRRHYFELTAAQHIRCIRLFMNQAGWEAIYDPKGSPLAEPAKP